MIIFMLGIIGDLEQSLSLIPTQGHVYRVLQEEVLQQDKHITLIEDFNRSSNNVFVEAGSSSEHGSLNL